MVKKLDPQRIQIAGGVSSKVVHAFIEHDFAIRSGQCPNRCGLLFPCEDGQECPICHFWCNTKAEIEEKDYQ